MYFKKLFFVLIILLVHISTFAIVEAKNKSIIKLEDLPEVWAEINLIGEYNSKIPSRFQVSVVDLSDTTKICRLTFGLAFKKGKYLLEPSFGYSFGHKEWIGALRIYPNWKDFKGYSNIEYQEKSKSFYYIGQFEAKIIPAFGIGIEAEGRGTIDHFQKSNGLGAYFVLNFEPRHHYKDKGTIFRTEFVLQNKKMNGQRRIQLILRFKISMNANN